MKACVAAHAHWLEDEKACTRTRGATSFILGSFLARKHWIQSHMPRKGCGTVAKPEQVYTQSGGRHS